ncbi:hypothetical protein Tco_1390260, partial [Tanacetum coccineum]
ETLLSRIVFDNMVVPQPDGDINVSMLKEAVQLINGKFETKWNIETKNWKLN